MFDIFQSILGESVSPELVSAACVILFVVSFVVTIDFVYRIFFNWWK